MNSSDFEIPAALDHTIRGTAWSGKDAPRYIIQLFHGLGEYHQRYKRFAEVAAAADVAVVAHDHRGHGPHTPHLGYFADHDGWQCLIDDGRLVNDWVVRRFPDTPIVLLGHSMGSYVAQAFAMQHADRMGALVLSASTWPEKSKIVPGRILAKLESWRHGKKGKSPLLDKLGFGDFNKAFEPADTALDWLSRDAAEVYAYIADPLCGGPYCCGLWLDLLAGLGSIGSDDALEKIPTDMPVLLTGGSADPVGGAKGIGLLAKHYALTGHQKLAVRIYDDGRHEMFNEINRDEFSRNILSWIDKQLPVVTRR